MKSYKAIVIYLFLLVVSLPPILPLFHSGFFPFHDAAQVQRVYEMAKALGDGMFPVRWVPDLGYGYGYPIFNFYAPFIYYLGSFFYFLGFSAISSIKLVVGISVLLSGFGMFLLARKIFNTSSAFVAAILYIYLPYHALDIYVRGDFAEAFAYSIFPFFIYAIVRFAEVAKWRWVIVGAISYAIIIISHNLSALMVTPVAIIIASVVGMRLYKQKKQKQLIGLMAIFFFGIAMASFYWLPTITEMGYTNVHSVTQGGSDYHTNFVCLPQLWDSPWGFGGSAAGCVDGLSFRVGKIHLLLALVAIGGLIYSFFIKKNRAILKGKRKVVIGLLVGLVLSLFLTLQISQTFWNIFSFMSFFQFPWRFLFLTGFFSSLLGAAVVWYTDNFFSKYKKIISSILLICIVIVTFAVNEKLFVPQKYTNDIDETYVSKQSLIWQTSKISDEYMPSYMKKPTSSQDALTYHQITTGNQALVKTIAQTTNHFSVIVSSSQQEAVHMHIAPFPAWHIFIDRKEVPYNNTPTGIRFNLPAGSHRVDVLFIPTFDETLGNIISIAGIVFLFAGILVLSL